MPSKSCLALALLLTVLPAVAAPLTDGEVPDPLKPWIGWALQGEDQRRCPLAEEGRECRWPSSLELDLNGRGGSFELGLRLYVPGWVPLPGDATLWPRDVTSNGQAAPVVEHDGGPALWLAAGEHRLRGAFDWKRLPEGLPLPADTGLVSLRVDGQERANPGRDAQGRLWLGATSAAASGDHLQLQVFRRVEDDIPLRLVTQLLLEVAGQAREAVLGPALPAGFTPLSLEGELPARLDEQGRLRVSLRPGVWRVTLVARAPAPVGKLELAKLPEPWPAEETWSVHARPELRVIEPGGAASLDPRQTQLPEEWKSDPAFLMQPGTALQLNERSRGEAVPPPDEITLNRELWLDFDGDGWTLRDTLGGKLSSRWRLEAMAPLELGRADADGEPQLITRLSAQAPAGVEVRHGQLSFVADSRVEDSLRSLPANGWNVELRELRTTLHLPPGWRLFAANGVDQADTWVSRWTLLDLFLVLVVTVASFRLFGAATGGIALAALALSWHEAGAPQWAWLNLIAAVALLRALPESLRGERLASFISRYRWVSVAGLLLIALPFAITQVREAMYPQLEQAGGEGGRMFGFTMPAANQAPSAPPMVEQDMAGAAPEEVQMAETEAVPAPAPVSPKPMPVPQEARRARDVLLYDKMSSASNVSQQSLKSLDPNALTQTGPGLPEWRWSSATLSAAGPVTSEQPMRLWLSPPWLTRTLKIVALALMALTLLRWMGGNWPRLPRRAAMPAVAAMLAAVSALGWTPPALAMAPPQIPELPEQTWLDELKNRLLAPPECAPRCAELPRMSLQARDNTLTLRLSVDAAVDAALPLPLPPAAAGAQDAVWQPQEALLDGRPAALRRDGEGQLWLAVSAGRHELLLRGSLAGFTQLQLPLPLAPRGVSAELSGWALAGLDEDGKPAATLQLSRLREAGAASSSGSEQALPALLVVIRTLRLGMDWEVETVLRREGVLHTPVLARVPLLPGERLTGENLRAVDGAVEVALAPQEQERSWRSRLEQSGALKLTATKASDLYEVWRFDVSPLWHADFSENLPPVKRQEEGYWLPQFQPWPGEVLAVKLTRPAGAQGQVVTLEQARLALAPGLRAREATLTLRLRAGQGGSHQLVLPAGWSLLGLSADGVPQPLRQSAGEKGTAVPLTLRPGLQNFELKLRSDEAMETLLHTPVIDLGLPGVNANLDLELPQDRWALLLGGPRLGPAVLFWSVLVVLFAVSAGLGRLTLTPLRARQWALLMVGLSQIPVAAAALVVGWLIALGWRGRAPETLSWRRFDLMQVGLVLLTLAALSTLFGAVAHGLLGTPDMQVTGNASGGNSLHWFADRYERLLPTAWVLSVPMWIYRLLMLAWALWLANALLGWLRWGWQQYGVGGLWKKKPVVIEPPKLPTAPG